MLARRTLRIALASLVACAVAPALAAAAPTLAVTASCSYSGGEFAVVGANFDPYASVALEVMETADPMTGGPLLGRTVVADARGTFIEAFDVPSTGGATSVLRALRARPSADARVTPVVLASAPLRTVARGVRVSGEGRALTARTIQRWHVTGLPEGTPLYAHYRRDGKTVARRSLGKAADPCGRLDFDLRVLPRDKQRSGRWEVWMTADRTFRRPRKGVYVRRRLTVNGSSSSARVRADAPTSRLAPTDPRLTAAVTNGMAADISQIGLISLTFVDAKGAGVEFLERVGDRLVRLGTAAAAPGEILTELKDATTWSCDRPERRFVATAILPSGRRAMASYSVRTPSCAARFELTAPGRMAPGTVARVRIVDRWAIGDIKPTLCVTPPAARRTCRRVALGRGVTVASHRFRAKVRGTWVVQLRIRDRRVRRTVVRVGGERITAPARPTLLASGDSTMQGIDSFLADELGETASVVSDVRIGTGISRSDQPSMPGDGDAQWGRLATEQTARLHQSQTVISLGAAEGFAMSAPDGAVAACCGAAWTGEYSRRTRLIMQTYARGGKGRVLWLTLPLPRDDQRRASTSAVNSAMLTAAEGLAGVKILRLDLLFTPDGYRDVIRYRGRDVAVRDADGIHLNVAGTAIAAKVIADELRHR